MFGVGQVSPTSDGFFRRPKKRPGSSQKEGAMDICADGVVVLGEKSSILCRIWLQIRQSDGRRDAFPPL